MIFSILTIWRAASAFATPENYVPPGELFGAFRVNRLSPEERYEDAATVTGRHSGP
jgi:hypothetical protein